MSQLNFTEGVYLDHHEMSRFDHFTRELLDKILKKKSKSLGIVDNLSQGKLSTSDYLVERGTNTDTNGVWTCKSREGFSVIDNIFKASGYLPKQDNIFVISESIDNVELQDSSDFLLNDKRVVVSRPYISYTEEGTCSINTSGQLTGVNTYFTQVLRGHNTPAPTKIKFINQDGSTPTNDSVYEVSNVVNDLTAQLVGGTFSNESSLRYIVLGSYDLSQYLNLSTKRLYSYIHTTTLALREANVLSTDLILADLVSNGDNTFTVVDRRQENSLLMNGELDLDWINVTGWETSINIRNDGAATPTVKMRISGDGTMEVFGRFKFSNEVPSSTGIAHDYLYKDDITAIPQVDTQRKVLSKVVLADSSATAVYDPNISATFSWGWENVTRFSINIIIPEASVSLIDLDNWYSFYIKQPIGLF